MDTMSKIKYLIIFLVATFIYSCAEDDFDTPPAPPSYNNVAPEITDSIDNKTAVLLKEDEDLVWDTLAWNPAKLYEGQGLITHYSVQVDSVGNNFADYIELESSNTSDTSIIISVGELNTALLKEGYNPVQQYDLELRIKSFVHDDLETLYTDVLPFTVTTYKDVPVPEELYLFGDATAVGWGADTALAFVQDGDNLVKFAYLENNKKFRFLKAKNTEDTTYNYESLVNLPSNVSAAGDDDKNFMFTGTTGWYKLEVNYLTSTLSIAEHIAGAETYTYDYTNLYIVGDYNAIDGAWDANNAAAFTKVSEGVFSIEKIIKDGAMIKFIGQQSWGDLEWANILSEGNSGIIGPKGSNGNITFDGGDKTYKIQVDLKQGLYSFTEIKTLPQAIYLVGSINGWNNYGQYIAALGNDVHVGYQYLDDASEIKILTERSSWDGSWGAGASAGEIADGGGNIVASALPTYTSEGFYEIKFDLVNKTVVLTPVAIGVIGNAQPGDWSTDTDLTFNTTSKVWEGQVTFFDTGEYKFRANDGWDISFGGSLDNIEYNAGNFATPGAGTYNVTLDLSGAEKFSATVTAVK